MRVLFAAAGQDAEVQSFYHWLRTDRELMRSVRVAAPTGTDREAMGAVDTVAAVSASVIGLGQLAFAFVGWRQTRQRPAGFTITRPDGAALVVPDGAGVDPATITAFLTAQPASPVQPASPAQPASIPALPSSAQPAGRRRKRRA